MCIMYCLVSLNVYRNKVVFLYLENVFCLKCCLNIHPLFKKKKKKKKIEKEIQHFELSKKKNNYIHNTVRRNSFYRLFLSL